MRKALTKLLILRGFTVKKVTGQVEKEWPISPSNPIYELWGGLYSCKDAQQVR